MIDQQQYSTKIQALNETELSQHVKTLMRQKGIAPNLNNLILWELLNWMVENHYQNQIQGEMEAGAVAGAAHENPQATYNNLADDQRLMQAQTLEQAAAVMAATMAWMFRE